MLTVRMHCARKWIELIIHFGQARQVEWRAMQLVWGIESILGHDQFSWRKHLNDPLIAINLLNRFQVRTIRNLSIFDSNKFKELNNFHFQKNAIPLLYIQFN